MLLPLLAVVIGVLSCLVLGRAAGAVVRTTRPSHAVVLLSAVSVTLALATGIALTAIGVAVGARIAVVAAQGQWSVAVLQAEVPIPAWLGALAVIAVGVLLLRSFYRTAGIVTALVRAEKVCRAMREGGPVVIVDDDSADAFTIAGIKGCVVISSRLLNALSADERRILTAHELSHLNRRHHLYIHAADIAAAANPLLHPVSAAVRLGAERWADEDAAMVVDSTVTDGRRMTGRTLARVALLRSALISAPSSGARVTPRREVTSPAAATLARATLAAATHQVAARVQALLGPAAKARTGRLAAAAVAALLVFGVGVASLMHIQDAIEAATTYAGR